MSHFSVLVVGTNVEQQLAPFQENSMGNCPREYMAFNDQEDEFRKEYETKSLEMIVMERFKRKSASILDGTKYDYPAGTTRREVPFRELYPTLEEFAKDWHGAARDPERGCYGHWENPNAKWDWYSVGGRWTGFFKVRAGALAEVGRPGLMTPPAKAGEADIARKCDVDWEAKKAPAGEKAAAFYDHAAAIIAQHPIPRSWDEIREDATIPDWDAKREAYREQPLVKALSEAKLDNWETGYDVEDYLMPRDQFIERARNRAITCFAFLRDGKWAEKGEMGWWGCVANEKDQGDWNAQFATLLASVPDGETLTVVDCHI